MIYVKRFFVLLLLSVATLRNSYAQNLDIDMLKSINPKNPTSQVWKQISSSGYWVPFLATSGTLVYGFIKNDKEIKQKGLNLVINLGVATVISQGMKYAINRPRPYEKYPNDVFPDVYEKSDPSFPSGHTTIAFNTAATLAMQYKKWYVAVPAYAWATSVGYSRMYLGKHYPSDVVAGAITGIGTAYLGNWLNKKLFQKK